MAGETQINCPSCNGFIDVVPGQSQYTCPWCGSAVDLFKLMKPKEAPPAPGAKRRPAAAPDTGSDIQLLVPFKVDLNAVHAFVMHTVIQPDYAPDDILSAGNVEHKDLLYIPCWEVKGTSAIDWTASFGYDRQEPYTAYETVTRGDRTYREPVTRYRTVTDWRPASGKARASFRVRAYAGTETHPEVAQMLETGLAGEASVPYAPAYTVGYSMEPFARTPADVRERVDALVYEIESYEVRSYAQGDRQRDWRHSSKRRFEAPARCVLPLCRATFSYGGNYYNFLADGVSMRLVKSDPLPRDTHRKSRVNRGFIPLWAALAAAVVTAIATGADHANGIVVILPPAAALVFALVRRSSILGFSRRFRQATLAQKRLDEYMQLGNLPYEEAEQLKLQAVLPVQGALARTGGDALLLPILSAVLAGLTVLGFFVG